MILRPGIVAANLRRAGVSGDPYWANVIGLWGWEASSPNHLSDEGPAGHDLTNTFSGFSRDTSRAKFGSASVGREGGTANSYATAPHHSDFIFSGAFTVECWHYVPDPVSGIVSAAGLIAKSIDSSGNRSWELGWRHNSTSNLVGYRARLSTDGTSYPLNEDPGLAYAPGVWRHICLERNESDLVRLYVDGTVVASATLSGTLYNNDTVPFSICGRGNGTSGMSGARVDEVRITKGVARYNGAFTPPTEPFPRS